MIIRTKPLIYGWKNRELYFSNKDNILILILGHDTQVAISDFPGIKAQTIDGNDLVKGQKLSKGTIVFVYFDCPQVEKFVVHSCTNANTCFQLIEF